MYSYLNLLRRVVRDGEKRMDRTGIGTRALFGETLFFNLEEGFPAVTTKKLAFKSVAAELAGFLEGTESAARMRELGTKIWDANANSSYWRANPANRGPDDMGRVYGSLWRNFYGVDQLNKLIRTIRDNPTDRRMVVTAWDPSESCQCLPPCHIFWQVFIRNNIYLDLQFYMRSVDLFLGLPFDIASYALLQSIIAQQVQLIPGRLTVIMGDTHVYQNHLDQIAEQLSRRPYYPPALRLDTAATIDNFKPEMAELVGYDYHPAISAPMAV